ncbi:hypothetical protein L1887_22613 [Cichorium endivia]|nr:hypothetical protein L1887_22613 [Cichorium endivia]
MKTEQEEIVCLEQKTVTRKVAFTKYKRQRCFTLNRKKIPVFIPPKLSCQKANHQLRHQESCQTPYFVSDPLKDDD